MSELWITRAPEPLPPGTAACMGAFDGFHRGHQALIARAAAAGTRVAVVTFDPHPARVLAPETAPQLICGPLGRERIVAALGVDHLVLLPFTRELAHQSPQDFVRTYLTEGLAPRTVVVGHDFRFGHRRAGDLQTLRTLLEPANIEVHVVDEVPAPAAAGERDLSSTSIRRALQNGDTRTAGLMLGRWHSVTGRVVTGARRGRTLGYPTANVAVSGGLLPTPGIYSTVFAVWDRMSEHYGAVWPSVSSLGQNPTFTAAADAPLVLEAHVLDRDLGESLYDLEVEVSFVSRLRDEKKFDGLDDLVAQIDRDAALARAELTTDVLAQTLAPPPEAP